MSILIAEIGGSKSDWWLIADDLVSEHLLSDEGYHPLLPGNVLEEKLVPQIQNILEHRTLEKIYYYGTGTSGTQARQKIHNILKAGFDPKQIEINIDLLASARALSAFQKSVVCILGTGSNSGYFDGSAITHKVTSGGILIGDEGSGAYLGKLLTRTWIYGELPEEISHKLELYLGMGSSEFIQFLYQQKNYSKELSKLSYFIHTLKAHDRISQLIEQNFIVFAERILSKYQLEEGLKFNFTGGVASTYRYELTKVLNDMHLPLGDIVDKPISKLIDYHISILKENKS